MSHVGCSVKTGCTDENACNYDIAADINDNSCWYAEACKDCNGDCLPECPADDCGVCGGNDQCCPPKVVDCNNECDGTATYDGCGICSGGTSGHVADSDMDCNGDCFGTAYIDNCGYCVGGETDLTACVQDCAGTWGGIAVNDACGVCEGDGSSCNTSILITGWKIRQQGQIGDNIIFNEGLGSPGDNLITYINCYSNEVDCSASNIDAIQNMMTQVRIVPTGGALDADGDGSISDYTINVQLAIYVERRVEVGGLQSAWHDIVGEDNLGAGIDPQLSVWKTYTPSNSNPDYFQHYYYNLDGFFDSVNIGGTTYDIGNDIDFKATYRMKLWIHDYEVEGHDGNFGEFNINDVNNPIQAEFIIDHQATFTCSGLPGDVHIAGSGNGVLNCMDYITASGLISAGYCTDWMNVWGETDPHRCCNAASLSPPSSQLNQDDLDILLNIILDGQGCY